MARNNWPNVTLKKGGSHKMRSNLVFSFHSGAARSKWWNPGRWENLSSMSKMAHREPWRASLAPTVGAHSTQGWSNNWRNAASNCMTLSVKKYCSCSLLSFMRYIYTRFPYILDPPIRGTITINSENLPPKTGNLPSFCGWRFKNLHPLVTCDITFLRWNRDGCNV